ncbi:hypothetical protein MYU51_000295 [Penicillium brevicompactum]|uniref:uncharacterized protein n=1 Tax=Penicillium brevicompactum TaxID=5074 RepID=UPI002540F2C2|nr:uncharacterized protein N7506_008649 [Penicillium brevicompactum]KAJ5325547.1 hypothetical protein N7506_008649 [Penicillium brevicompactum]
MSGNDRSASRLTEPSAVPQSGPSDADASVPIGDTYSVAKPTKRRRTADPKNKSTKNQHFYFVDQNSSSKEKRAHVMRHHVQEKRKHHKTLRGPLSVDPGAKNAEHHRSGSSSAAGQPSDVTTSLQIRFSNMKTQPHPSLPQHIGSPVTILDASRKDPFSSLPMEYNSTDIELADYWRNKLTYWSGQNVHVKNQIFRTAMGHPLSFKAVVLSYCARWKAQLYGMTDSDEIQRHVGEAAKLIEEATSGSAIVRPDDLAMALGGMALQEERFGSKKLAQVYVNRAVQVLRPRTGFNRPVETFIHYVRYLMLPEVPTSSPAEQKWLITFLHGARDLMRRHSTPEYLHQVPHRLYAFEMGSPLFTLLSSGPRPSQVPQESRVYVVRHAQTQEVSRTASLIYITAALWDYQESPIKTDRFLGHLWALVKQHHLDRDPACETLLWLLLEEGYDSDLQDPERAWSTGELLRVHKQLRPDLQFLWNEILMSFLSFQAPIRGVEAFEEEMLHSTSP